MPEGIPQSAQRVFKGALFEIWQWEQVLFDGGMKIFEKAVRPDSCAVIPVSGNTIIIQIQDQPHVGRFYSLPGGRVDDGEDPLHAAQRELLEETGYESKDWELVLKDSPPHHVSFTYYLYVARKCDKKNEMKLDAGEKIELRFLSFDEFLLLSDEPTFRHECMRELLLRARYDAEKRRELQGLLFGSALTPRS
ncbi:NUDIX hydrolase [Candidatus Uhrbacteria bacterium]|nr:NUDIX hydrolase [Candidatus Uhrbacteria bacterium]